MTTSRLDIFALRDSVVDEYQHFATSFTTIRAPDITAQVEAIYAEARYSMNALANSQLEEFGKFAGNAPAAPPERWNDARTVAIERESDLKPPYQSDGIAVVAGPTWSEGYADTGGRQGAQG